MGLRSRDALLNRGKKSRGVAGGAGLGLGERLKPKDLNRQGSQSRVVAHLRNGQLLKGYASLLPQNDPDAVLKDRSVALPAEITLRLADSTSVARFSQESLKALFFVKSFEGHALQEEIKHFKNGPPIAGLWVRLRFYDKEFTEGVVRNSLHFLNGPGFFLKPPDPHSNNEMLYVVKSSLVEFMVRGVRYTY